jgi:hypothetical protein
LWLKYFLMKVICILTLPGKIGSCYEGLIFKGLRVEATLDPMQRPCLCLNLSPL